MLRYKSLRSAIHRSNCIPVSKPSLSWILNHHYHNSILNSVPSRTSTRTTISFQKRSFYFSLPVKNYNQAHIHPEGSVSTDSEQQHFRVKDSLAEISRGQACSSCGIDLQTTKPDEAGFINEQIIQNQQQQQQLRYGNGNMSKKKFVKKTDQVYNAIYDNLTAEEKKLMMNIEDTAQEYDESLERKTVLSQGETEPTIKNGNDISTKEKDLYCLRCHEALFHNKYFNFAQTSEIPLDIVLKSSRITDFHQSIIYHVISANDFPHTLNLDLLNYVQHPSKQIRFIINKSDLLINHSSFLNKFGLDYFHAMLNEFLSQKYETGEISTRVKISKEQVFLVSAANEWNIAHLYNSLPVHRKIYFVGEANVGKSSLIKSLLVYDFFLKQKKQQQSPHGKNKIANNFKEFVKKQESFIQKNVSIPGTFVLPGTTQGILTYKVNNDKVVINDLPGYSKVKPNDVKNEKSNTALNLSAAKNNSSYGIYSILKPSWIKHLSKPESQNFQQNVKKSRMNFKKNPYISLINDDCFTLGGLFFLRGPAQSITQIRTNTHEKGHKFSNLAKALTVCRDPPKAIESVVGLANGQESLRHGNLKRFLIPPFFGSVDLVIKGLGFITITPTRSVEQLKKLQLGSNKNEASGHNENLNNKAEEVSTLSLTEDEITERLQQCDLNYESKKTAEKLLNLATFNLYEFFAPSELEFYIRESIDSYLVKKNLVKTTKVNERFIHDKDTNELKKIRNIQEDWIRTVKPIEVQQQQSNNNAESENDRKYYSKVIEVPSMVTNLSQWYWKTYLTKRKIPQWYKKKQLWKGFDDKEIEKEEIRAKLSGWAWSDTI